MIFAKVDVRLLNHPRALSAGPAAMGLWLWSVLYVRGMELEEAIVPDMALRSVWGANGRVTSPWVKKLVEAGLWERVPVGFRIVRYQQSNELRSDIEARRERDRSRKALSKKHSESSPNSVRKAREESVGFPGSDSDSVFVSDQGGAGGSQPESTTGVRKVPPPSAHELRYRAAYESGIAEGKGGPFAWDWRPWDQGALNRAIQEFSRGRRGDFLLQWVRAAAKDFAKDVASRGKPHFYDSYGPKGLLKWLGEVEADSPEARS